MSFRNCYSALFVLLLTSVLAFAQEERRTEFSVGYSNLQAEGMPDRNDPNNFFSSSFLNRRTTLHGVNGEVTLYPLESSLIGLTGNISFNRKHRSADVTGGSNQEHTDVWYFMAGPAYVFPDQGRLVPFVRVMAGLAHTGYEAAQERSVANGNLRSTFNIGSNDFAMAFGAGIDVKLNDRIKIRLIQADYAPIFLGDRAVAVLGAAGVLQPRVLSSQRQDNVRFTFGVTF
jgi:opacity protein-like surface antigen